jgi:hypothetical protein
MYQGNIVERFLSSGRVQRVARFGVKEFGLVAERFQVMGDRLTHLDKLLAQTLFDLFTDGRSFLQGQGTLLEQ